MTLQKLREMKNLLAGLNPFARKNREVHRLRAHYLSLLQDILTNRIYEDPPRQPFGTCTYDPTTRENGLDWPATAHTMIGVKRLANLR
jgi:hypothetical protein